jgi:peptidoglycan/LPS O-acetylase OafA/YrhL
MMSDHSSSGLKSSTAARDSDQRLAYIDCLRGYAVLLVITSHLTYAYPNLPYPVHRVTILGWYGVQLFFLASAITLMMSWSRDVIRYGRGDISSFFLRRFFRIAPAYYTAALFYYLITPPAVVDLAQLAAWLGFLNDWHPALTVEALGAWSVVPGGWSISAEFSFYLVFPLAAKLATSQRRAFVLFLVVCLGTMAVNTAGQYLMLNRYEKDSVGNFMYFWAPNQAPVFALGILLFFILSTPENQLMQPVLKRLPVRTTPLFVIGLAIFLSIAFLSLPKALTFNDFRPPALMQASLGFALMIIALAQPQPGWLVNRWIVFVGKISFSAYLVHFSVIELISGPLARFSARDKHDYSAILAFTLAWLAVVAITIIFSTCTYYLIEDPGIKLGRRVIALQQRLRRAAPSTSI